MTSRPRRELVPCCLMPGDVGAQMSRESPGLGDRARCSVRGRPSFSSLCKPREGQVQGASVSVVQGRMLVWQPAGPAAALGWPSPSCESESPGDFLKAQMPRTFHSHTEPDSPRISRKHRGGLGTCCLGKAGWLREGGGMGRGGAVSLCQELPGQQEWLLLRNTSWCLGLFP